MKKVLAYLTLGTMLTGLLAAAWGGVSSIIDLDRRIEKKAEKEKVNNLESKIDRLGDAMCFEFGPDTCSIIRGRKND